MQADPIAELRGLTEHYRGLSDDELRNLSADLADLTETAQQALRTEMQSRGLRLAAHDPFADPLHATNAPVASNAPLAQPAATIAASHDYQTSASIQNQASSASSFFARQPQLVPDTPDNGAELDGPVDYTWKTPLCDCDTSLQARELSEALKQAGIERWIEAPGTGSPTREFRYARFSLSSPRVLVAADQLDQARAIAAQPIPRQIVEDAQTEIPDYQPPNCPKCGASDPDSRRRRSHKFLAM